MRLFLAVEPDRGAQAHIARLLLDVQRVLGGDAAALRWTPATNVHVTLHFLGELDPRQSARLVERLGEHVEATPFDVAIDSIGFLPPSGGPRVLYAAVSTGAEELTSLYDSLAVRVRAAGVNVETRAFLPHLTLARVRDRERQRARTLRERLSAVPAPLIRWTVHEVTLFRSDLSGPTPRYDPVHRLGMPIR
jgi:RNA 2',3'-cyclic 3'-phosphodiesterase